MKPDYKTLAAQLRKFAEEDRAGLSGDPFLAGFRESDLDAAADLLLELGDKTRELIKRIDDLCEGLYGEWIEEQDYDETIYTCSNCHESFVTIEGTPADNLWNYCPNCGAYMGKGMRP